MKETKREQNKDNLLKSFYRGGVRDVEQTRNETSKQNQNGIREESNYFENIKVVPKDRQFNNPQMNNNLE